jgi:hypothetical protein
MKRGISKFGVVATLLLLLAFRDRSAATPIPDLNYQKTFFLNDVAAGAGISAAAEAQTWATPPPNEDYFVSNHKVTDDINVSYTHGSRRTSDKILDGTLPFPVSPTGKTVDPPLGGYSGTTGLATDGPPHYLPNKAQADITVNQRIPGAGPVVIIRLGGGGGNTGPVALMNSVKGVISGFADSGKPTYPDADTVHSADSFGAVEIKAAKVFQQVTPGAQPEIEAVGRNVAVASAISVGSVKDPYFLTVNDLTTGVSTTEQIMSETVDAVDAGYSIDDTGILLTIDRGDPTSSLSLAFSNAVSPWVLNPYTYGAALNNTGFSAFGETPLSGWSVTTTADTVEAFFAFGPDGEPFDSALVLPPDSLFTVGDMYTYDAGTDSGGFELQFAPEPSTFLLLASGLVGMLSYVCDVGSPLPADRR